MTAEQWALAAAIVAVLALMLAVLAVAQLAAVRRRYAVLYGNGEVDMAALAHRQQRRAHELAAEIDRLRGDIATLRTEAAQGLRHVAVVRYDAFGDMGGRLSFSAAALDDHGDGLVISSIHGRAESRTYAKAVVNGRSEITLTPEEQQALASAKAPARRKESR